MICSAATAVDAAAPARRLAWLLACLAALLMLAALSVTLGARSIPLAEVWHAFTAFDAGDGAHLLVRELRVPRTLMAIVAGAALGGAGTLMQALTRNPLADPGLLGVNAGAATAIVGAIAWLGLDGPQAQLLAGLLGAGLAGLAVYLFGGVRRGLDPLRLVLAGAALSAVLLALTQIMTLNSEDEVFDQFRHWAVGSLQGRGYGMLWPVAGLVVPGAVLACSLARALDAVSLGREMGASLGARPAVVWGLSAAAIIVLSGAATAAVGPIAFLGLAAPHLARWAVGMDHRWALPFSMALGALLLLGADVAGRWIAAPGEVGVGIMTALIGGPFFVALARRREWGR